MDGIYGRARRIFPCDADMILTSFARLVTQIHVQRVNFHVGFNRGAVYRQWDATRNTAAVGHLGGEDAIRNTAVVGYLAGKDTTRNTAVVGHLGSKDAARNTAGVGDLGGKIDLALDSAPTFQQTPVVVRQSQSPLADSSL